MWHKTISGLLSGLIFLLFIPTGLSLLFPTAIAFLITLTILLFIPIWAGIMTYCYAASNAKQSWLRAFTFSLSGIVFYSCAYFTLGLPQ